jgi:monoamine oxidase
MGHEADIDNLEEVDVAIVGGGVAGCYLGHRLVTSTVADLVPGSLLAELHARCGGKLVVGLYESSDRIGGRLWSVRLPGVPGVTADLGGMRFGDEIHIVADLIRNLGLDRAVEAFSFGEPENLAYVRGVRFRQRQLSTGALAKDPESIPYRVRPREQGRSAGELLELAADAAVPDFSARRRAYHTAFAERRWRDADAISEAYARARSGVVIAGIGLNDLPWSTLFSLTLSREAIALTEDVGGYNTRASCGNASGWLDTIFFAPPDARTLRLKEGFEALPRALHNRYRAAGGRTRMLHRLRRFDAARGAPGYELIFHRGEDGPRAARVHAQALVLAMPRRGLERLDQDNFFFREEALQKGLRSVKGIDAVKLFLAYPNAWWEQVGVTNGRSTTDLPLRQLWYCGGEGRGGPALILAAYANGSAAAYWANLRRGEPYPDAPPGAALDGAQVDCSSAPLATRTMVERAHAMLMEVHGVEEAPAPSAARFQDWSVDPHGGGWHVWQERSDPWRIIPFMRQPLPGEAVFIASDCWSHEPGSVQGSLSTAECVLQDHLGLRWPNWLRREGTRLGPRLLA